MVDAVGFAVTLLPVVALNPIDGNQEYVVAPPVVNNIEDPRQMDEPLLTVSVGVDITVTVTIELFVQFPFIPVTV